MKFSIKTKLIAALCMPLLLIGAVFIASLLNTQNAVITAGQDNVKTKVALLLHDVLQGQVDTITRSINDYYEQSKFANIKQTLVMEMSAFRTTINNIYQHSESTADAKSNIYAFLNHHRWDDGRYFFAYDPDTWISKAYGSNLEWVGVNGYNKTDAKGNYFVRDVVASALNNNIGFSQYSFLNPSTSQNEDKITASFYFQPLNLVIATGEYFSTLQQSNIAAALHAIVTAKYGNNGYFWIQDSSGKILAHPQTDLIGTTLPSTLKVASSLQSKQQAFVEIQYINPTTGVMEKKLTFARYIFPEWGWTIATGAYESDVLSLQNGFTAATNQVFEERTSLMIFVTSLLVLFSFAIAIWVISFTLKGIALQKDLINSVSHELRTPIARLRFGVEMLQNYSPSDSGSYINGVQQDINELENLVSELLTYARFDRNVSDLKLENLPVAPWLEEVLVSLSSEVSAHLLHVFMVDESVYSYFEPKYIRRAVSNLVHNAAKYGNGEVFVTLEQQENTFLIHVDDDGPGIPEADWERVFEPFARLDSSRSRDSGGYGLGLAIVKRMLDAHNGSVYLASSPLGGCRFTICWRS